VFLSIILPGTSTQIIIAICLTQLSIILIRVYEPYLDNDVDILSEIGSYQIMMTFFITVIAVDMLTN